MQPAHTPLGKLLNLGSQFGLHETEIVHGADAQEIHPRVSLPDTVHERPASRAEIVGHGFARADGFSLAVGLQVLAAAQPLYVLVGDGEVGCEHGRGDFVAVRAVADEGIDQARGFGWECQLHGATEACGRCFTFFGIAVIGLAGQREIGLGFVDSGGHGCLLL